VKHQLPQAAKMNRGSAEIRRNWKRLNVREKKKPGGKEMLDDTDTLHTDMFIHYRSTQLASLHSASVGQTTAGYMFRPKRTLSGHLVLQNVNKFHLHQNCATGLGSQYYVH
jgi:hypothetical protein